MPSDEYRAVVSSAIKLKGTGSDSKIVKKKKKKPKSIPTSDAAESGENGQQGSTEGAENEASKEEAQALTKTAAEIRHEERRQKMLDDKLRREGYKTHKERVENLNRYLSALSEHHDMYVSIAC